VRRANAGSQPVDFQATDLGAGFGGIGGCLIAKTALALRQHMPTRAQLPLQAAATVKDCGFLTPACLCFPDPCFPTPAFS